MYPSPSIGEGGESSSRVRPSRVRPSRVRLEPQSQVILFDEEGQGLSEDGAL
jgi:hypothetical protein